MTPLPAALDGAGLIAWRLDAKVHRATWDSGEGSFRAGGRWNSKGRRIVYCSIDPATAILEVAVHKKFLALDTVPHVLTSLEIEPSAQDEIFIVRPGDVPNKNWLVPGLPGAGQQAYGDQLTREHPFVLIPSVVSVHSWNLIFDSTVAHGMYRMLAQEDFALDTRLHPA